MLKALRYGFFVLCLHFLSAEAAGQVVNKALLQARIQAIIDTSGAKLGVGILGLDFGDSLTINGAQHFPMQSVFKFPLAIAVLHQVDAGTLRLTQQIHIRKESLDTSTWSPMLKEFPGRDLDMTLADVLRYLVSKSDNNACDVLFKLMGGTAPVERYIHKTGVRGIAIKADEMAMKKAWAVQYTNWCSPLAMLQLLRLFYQGHLLSKAGNSFLMKLMTESENSPDRIKGLLPVGAGVAHKTGTSGTNETGMKAATNDIGIVTLPDGRHYALVVYISDYMGGTQKGERIIALISKLVWDAFQ